MIEYVEQDGALIFNVRVVPNASRSHVTGEHDGALRVRIAAMPVEGAANEELTRTLAGAFKVRRQAVQIVAGHHAKIKSVEVRGASLETLRMLASGG